MKGLLPPSRRLARPFSGKPSPGGGANLIADAGARQSSSGGRAAAKINNGPAREEAPKVAGAPD